MSVTSEPEPVGAHNSMHYPPRRLRAEPKQRLAAADDIRALHENRPETVRHAISRLAAFDSQLENAAYESLRRPLDSHAMRATRALGPEMARRGTLFRVAGRLATVIGVSAITWQFFLIMMPPVQQSDSTQLFAAAVQAFTTAHAQQHQSEGALQPTLAEFRSLLTSGDTTQIVEREQTENGTDEVLQRFLQWRQKANPSEAAR
jgi:hypothetical protein